MPDFTLAEDQSFWMQGQQGTFPWEGYFQRYPQGQPPRYLWDSHLGTWYILGCGSTGLCAEISVCVCTVVGVTAELVAAATIHCYQYSGLLTAKPQLYACTQREWKKFHYL